jgi:hypothetical protein
LAAESTQVDFVYLLRRIHSLCKADGTFPVVIASDPAYPKPQPNPSPKPGSGPPPGDCNRGYAPAMSAFADGSGHGRLPWPDRARIVTVADEPKRYYS